MRYRIVTVGLCTLAAMACLMGASAPLDAEQAAPEEPAAGVTREDPEAPYGSPEILLPLEEEEPETPGEAEALPEDVLPEDGQPEAETPRISFGYQEPVVSQQVVQAVAGTDPMPLAEEAEKALKAAHEVKRDGRVTIDGEAAPATLNLQVYGGTPYVAVASLGRALEEDVSTNWNKKNSTLTLQTSQMTVTAKVGQLYVQANGRYLYVPAGVKWSNDHVMLPLATAAKIFDASASWNASAGTAALTSGSGALKAGSAYYDGTSLFWLSRVIYRESGNQPLEGKMAVGNVVLNRVSSSLFPNTILGVLSQKNQFTTYANGKLKATSPNAESVIAAKLVLDGGVVAKTKGAMWFDSAASSWASKHRTYVATIGGHRFFK